MDSRDGNVVSNPDIAGGVPPDLQVMLVICIEDEKHFGFAELFPLITWAQSLKDYEILFGALHIDNICDSIVDIDREREFLFTKLAIDLFELDNYVALNCFHSLVSL